MSSETDGPLNLLLINFEMNPHSPVLAWQFRVACQIARQCDKVVVLTHHAAPFEAPRNLVVLTFPRALLRAPARWLGGAWLMNAFVWRLCRHHKIDCCFIHMNMQWAYRLYPTFKLLGVPCLMWFAHGTVTWQLRLAHRCATRVITSTPEGFRIPSAKVVIVGQGVDTALFDIRPIEAPSHTIITVGRVSPRKRLDLQIEVIAALRELTATRFSLEIVGPGAGPEDEEYARHLRARAQALGVAEQVTFLGALPIDRIPAQYTKAFLHLNVSQTGSMDKTVVEALASGCPVLTSNEAFRGLLAGHPQYFLEDTRPDAIAKRVLALHASQSGLDREALRGLVVGKHDLPSYVGRVLQQLRALRRPA